MATKILYQIVGRYMNGSEVTGYHLQSMETGKQGKYTKEQTIFLVGRGQVTNCSGQIYQDKVILRGVGVSLEDLPVKQENGSLSRTDLIGKVRKGTSSEDAMIQAMVVGSIVDGRNVVGYILKNAGGGTIKAPRDRVIELARNGRIGNMRVQQSNGKDIIRGVGVDLGKLPQYTRQDLASIGTAR